MWVCGHTNRTRHTEFLPCFIWLHSKCESVAIQTEQGTLSFLLCFIWLHSKCESVAIQTGQGTLSFWLCFIWLHSKKMWVCGPIHRCPKEMRTATVAIFLDTVSLIQTLHNGSDTKLKNRFTPLLLTLIICRVHSSIKQLQTFFFLNWIPCNCIKKNKNEKKFWFTHPE